MIYWIAEEEYLRYPWCSRILNGIHEEAKRKRIRLEQLPAEPISAETGSCVLLVGASRAWNNQMICLCKRRHLHPIILSNQLRVPADETVSSVMMDIHSSMTLAVNYLNSLGRHHLALYGVNPRASSDPWRASLFRELTGKEDAVYTLEPTAAEAFDRFYAQIHRYDGVICTSDYAAVSLIRRLKEKRYDLPERLYIVSYGDMHLSKLITPSITSISDDFESFGRAALSVCSLIGKNHNFASVRISLHSKLQIRQTTQNRPYDRTGAEDADIPVSENRFFSDMEISDLVKLETLFSQCDETDFLLIQLLLKALPYANMAQQCYISETAAKYRVKKMQQLCGLSSREELVHYLKQFFN